MNTMRLIRQLRRSIGLEPTGFADYALPAVGILALGALAGAGVALLFAPTTGRRLREEMEQRFLDIRSRLMLAQGEQSHAAHNNSAEGIKAVPHLSPNS